MNNYIKNIMRALESNNMSAFYAEDCSEVKDIVKKLVKKGETISCGGTETLKQTGVMDIMRSGEYNFLDRDAATTKQESEQIYKDTFSVDTFFCSANALTKDGLLYNVDGRSNRVAAMVYGPKSVICIVGVNKIVGGIEAAVKRVKTIAAPLNAKRLGVNTPCAKTGVCSKAEEGMGSGCSTPDRICANFVVSGYQREKGRIKVIICNQQLGY